MGRGSFAFIVTPLAVAALVACGGRDRSVASDAGAPATDAGPADGAEDASPPDDAGSSDIDAGPTCEEDIVTPYAGQPCSSETRACVEACTTGSSCIDGCLARDPSPLCNLCVERAIVSCYNRNGCQASWSCFRACVQFYCAGMPGSCIDEHCAAEDDAWYECTVALGPDPCASRYLDCLP